MRTTPSKPRHCPRCRSEHAADAACVPHWGARQIGMTDAQQGLPFDETNWPPGRYGHADYAIGYYGVMRPYDDGR